MIERVRLPNEPFRRIFPIVVAILVAMGWARSGCGQMLTPMSEREFQRQMRELELEGELLDRAHELFEQHRTEIRTLEETYRNLNRWMRSGASADVKEQYSGTPHPDLPKRDMPIFMRSVIEIDRLDKTARQRLHDDVDRTYFTNLFALRPDADAEILAHLRMSWRRARHLRDDGLPVAGASSDVIVIAQRVLPDVMQHPQARPLLLQWERDVDALLTRILDVAETRSVLRNDEFNRARRGETDLDFGPAAAAFTEPMRLRARILRASERTLAGLGGVFPESADALQLAWWRAKHPFLWSDAVSPQGEEPSPLAEHLRAVRQRAARELDQHQQRAIEERYVIEYWTRAFHRLVDRSVEIGDDRPLLFHRTAARFIREIEEIEERIAEESARANR